MTSRARLLVLLISVPLLLLVVVGGVLSRTISPPTLRISTCACSTTWCRSVMNNYVEQVEADKIMNGAMRGLAEGLDPDCAWLTAADVTKLGKGAPPKGSIGVELTRQYYLRVISARDGSPAARAGLRTGDFIRAIDDKPTREMSVFEGMGLLRGAPGTKVKLVVIRGNAAEPHEVEITRARSAPPRWCRADRQAWDRPRARRRLQRSDASRSEAAGDRADQRRREARDPRPARHGRRRAGTGRRPGAAVRE